jgi:beta-phosphoglucomutase-like phosphatase (HAD superfamily)
MKKLSLLLTLSLLTVLPSIAGWYILEVTNNMGIHEQKQLWVQGKKMKHTEGNYDFIYDQEKKTITFIDNTTKIFWSGTAENFKKEMKEAQDELLEKQLLKMPEEQREKYKAMLKKQEELTKEEEANPSKVEVIESTQKATIATYACTKYQIKVNDVLTEELWVTTAFNPFKELDFGLFDELMKSIVGGTDYSDDKAYKELLKKGYVMRKTDLTHKIGNVVVPIMEEVKKAKEQEIPASTFMVPDGYQRMPLSEMMLEQSNNKQETDGQ